MATFDEFFASLDLDEEGNVKTDKTEKGLPFEQIFVKWFLLNDPIWSSKVDRFLETGQDLGIDLIFRDKEGNKWAVQSKGYSPSTYITKSDIDSFISDSPTSEFYGRLLIASTDRIGTNADKTLKKNKVVRFLLKDFHTSSINFPSNIKELSKVKKRKPFSRRNHQIKAVNEVLEKINAVNRGQVLMACGTGKTLTSLWIKEDLKAKQVLVLVPSLNLLSQTLSAWRNNLSDPFEWQCVCSDKTVHKKKKNDLDEDWINDPSELGIPVTSDSEEIKKFLLKKESKVLFSTYQSSELIVEVQKDMQVPNFDIIFADEAHKCAGKISKDFSYVLDNEKIRGNKRLFFTATPRVLSKKIKTQAIKTETEIASMDDTSIFGDVLHVLKFSDAIKQKILSDYQVVVIGIDDVLISEKIKNRDFIKTSKGEIIDAESLALQIALAKGIKKYNLRRIINFHSQIAGAQLFRDTFEKTINEMPLNEKPMGKISCDYVEGRMTTDKRNEKIRDLEKLEANERKILGNAKCLSEGVDVPSLDGITFVDPKSSEVDIIQAVGRVIRKGNKGKNGTILIPIYLQDLKDVEDQVLASRFSDVWTVIQALKCHDDVLKENIDNLRISYGKRKIKREGYKGLKLHTELPAERISVNFINSIETLLIENTSDAWFEKYGELEDFFYENGHSNIGRSNERLGRWVEIQRSNYKKGKLSKERFELLSKLNFVWDIPEHQWNENYQELKIFFKQNGHSNPPTNTQLGKWVSDLRLRFKKGKLSKERIELLKELNFAWDILEHQWNENYQELKIFFQKNNNSYPSQKTALGNWVGIQRKLYKQNKLSTERIELLNKLNFVWDIPEQQWNENYQELKKFFKQNGHSSPPTNTQLGKWVVVQRKVYKDNKLSTERIELLNKLSFVWDILEHKWNENYQELKKFFRQNGHSNAPKDNPLSSWSTQQRKNYRENKLSNDQIELLNQINFVWENLLDNKWDEKYEELKIFFKQNGHSSPPNIHPLSRWVGKQRTFFKKNKLSNKRIELLNQLNFVWDLLDDQWHNKYREFILFLKENSNSYPNSRNTLGRWVEVQRRNYKKGKLSSKYIKLLNEINFIWSISSV